ncbi:MAG: RpoL/Rpb11 RNA polymerase subunit family protein [Promethearchaeota archaeon]
MSKRKTAEKKIDDEIFKELDKDEILLEDIRKEDQAIKSPTKTSDTPSAGTTSSEDLAELLSQELTEPSRDFKYLKIAIEQEGTENEYYVHVKHQSHGLMNYLITKVLKCKGVDFAAYKNTSLEPPVMYIRTDGSRDIKNILKEALKLMRIDWKGMGNAVNSLKI